MVSVTLAEGKRRLGSLIELARKGEDIVITKKSRPMVTLKPVDDWNTVTAITDEQADRLDRWIESARKKRFASPSTAVRHLRSQAMKSR